MKWPALHRLGLAKKVNKNMLIFLRKEWRYFLLALGFFTRIPVPSFNDFKESELNKSVKTERFIIQMLSVGKVL